MNTAIANNSKKTIVFLPGLGIKTTIGLQLLKKLTTINHKALLLDLPDPSDEILQQPIEKQLHYITGKLILLIPDDSIIIGWSLGGLIATALYHYAPQKLRKLIVISSSPKFKSCSNWHCISNKLLENFHQQAINNFEKLLQHFSCLITHPNHNIILPLEKTKHNNKKFLFYLNILCNTDTRAILTTIKIPSLYIFGKHDAIIPWTNSNQIKNSFPHVNTTVIPKAGHLSFISHTSLIINQINSFLENSLC